MMKKISLIIFIAACSFAAGFFFKNRQDKSIPQGLSDFKVVRESAGKFQFIQPLLAVGDNPSLRQFPTLEHTIQKMIQEKKRVGAVDAVSVYFKDFATSRWGGVEENEKYSPASMYKVAILISALKEAEMHPDLLTTKIVYSGQNSVQYGDESNTSPDPIQKGKEYVVADLLRRMIIYSDNNAKDLLVHILNKDTTTETYTDLGLGTVEPNDKGDIVSPKTFSLLFRVLYNASYLQPSLSELALSLLAKTTFVDGLVAGVPKNILIAHKFGYREASEDAAHQLHDCGIVYFPEHPYFLCVMTRGKNITSLTEIIRDISRVVYEYQQEETK